MTFPVAAMVAAYKYACMHKDEIIDGVKDVAEKAWDVIVDTVTS